MHALETHPRSAPSDRERCRTYTVRTPCRVQGQRMERACLRCGSRQVQNCVTSEFSSDPHKQGLVDVLICEGDGDGWQELASRAGTCSWVVRSTRRHCPAPLRTLRPELVYSNRLSVLVLSLLSSYSPSARPCGHHHGTAGRVPGCHDGVDVLHSTGAVHHQPCAVPARLSCVLELAAGSALRQGLGRVWWGWPRPEDESPAQGPRAAADNRSGTKSRGAGGCKAAVRGVWA